MFFKQYLKLCTDQQTKERFSTQYRTVARRDKIDIFGNFDLFHMRLPECYLLFISLYVSYLKIRHGHLPVRNFFKLRYSFLLRKFQLGCLYLQTIFVYMLHVCEQSYRGVYLYRLPKRRREEGKSVTIFEIFMNVFTENTNVSENDMKWMRECFLTVMTFSFLYVCIDGTANIEISMTYNYICNIESAQAPRLACFNKTYTP